MGTVSDEEVTHKTFHRLTVVVILTLLPWPAVWLGMYHIHSIWWTFFLYHGVCLLPPILYWRKLWINSWRKPTRRQLLSLVIGFIVALPLFLIGYLIIGRIAIDRHVILQVMTSRGFHARNLLPLGLYFVPVNAVLEELFWRGVILNELHGVDKPLGTLGATWTAGTFAAWHWLVIRLLLRPGWAEFVVAGIVIAGIFFSWLYRQTKSIIVPILWHSFVFDFALVLVLALVIHG